MQTIDSRPPVLDHAAGAAAAPSPEPLQSVWETMERIPTGAYYAAVGASVALAASLFIAGKKESAQFVGQWAPTFALLGLMNKILQPARRP